MLSILSRFGLARATQPVPQLVEIAGPPLQGAEMAVAYFSERSGGDFYEFVRVGPHRVLFGLMDVAGKRNDNRAVLRAAQLCFRTSGAELLAASDINESDAMIELAGRMNRAIMRAAGGVRSCPVFAGCYNEELGTACYVNAGHTPGLLRDHSGIVDLPATGLPLGLFSLAPTDARTVGLGPHSALAVVSRGVTEAECRHKEFGLAGVKSVMEKSPAAARELSKRILEAVQTFMQCPPKHNDVTALTLTRENPQN